MNTRIVNWCSKKFWEQIVKATKYKQAIRASKHKAAAGGFWEKSLGQLYIRPP